MKGKFVNIKNARKGEYKDVIKSIYGTGKCPFCKENFKYHKKPVLKKKDGWFITEASWPYKNARWHFLIIGDAHKENFSQLTSKDFMAISFLTNWATKKYNIGGGCFAARFGDTNLTGSSVAHLHFHIIVPQQDKKTKKVKIVNFPIG